MVRTLNAQQLDECIYEQAVRVTVLFPASVPERIQINERMIHTAQGTQQLLMGTQSA
ncbi:hypothetical protein D3C76_1751750 [compost metagenome]